MNIIKRRWGQLLQRPWLCSLLLHIALLFAVMIFRQPASSFSSPVSVPISVHLAKVGASDQQHFNKPSTSVNQLKSRQIVQQQAAAMPASHLASHAVHLAKRPAHHLKPRKPQGMTAKARAALHRRSQQLLQQLAVQQQQQAAQALPAETAMAQQIGQAKLKLFSQISGHWFIPKGVPGTAAVTFDLWLAPNGAVTRVQLLHSSGVAALDQSARLAVLRASPLSVPHDPQVFEHFRHIQLTFSPQHKVAL